MLLANVNTHFLALNCPLLFFILPNYSCLLLSLTPQMFAAGPCCRFPLQHSDLLPPEQAVLDRKVG